MFPVELSELPEEFRVIVGVAIVLIRLHVSFVWWINFNGVVLGWQARGGSRPRVGTRDPNRRV